MKPHAILETCLYVDDLSAAEKFYQDVLGLELVSRQEGRHAFFRCGRQMLLLFDPAASNEHDSETPPHGAHGPGHLAFAADEDQLDGWMQRLRGRQVAIEKVVRWPSGVRSFYFRDPSGNSLEFAPPSIWGLDSLTEKTP